MIIYLPVLYNGIAQSGLLHTFLESRHVHMRSQARLCVSMDKQCGSTTPSAPSLQDLIDRSSSSL